MGQFQLVSHLATLNKLNKLVHLATVNMFQLATFNMFQVVMFKQDILYSIQGAADHLVIEFLIGKINQGTSTARMIATDRISRNLLV